MPGFKAIVVGENFEFMVDDEPQLLDFSRTVYVNAADESVAQQVALALVREDLLSQSMLDDDSEQMISIDDICQADVLAERNLHGGFIWHFPDDELSDEDE